MLEFLKDNIAVIAQIIGIFSTIATVSSFQFKTQKGIMIMQTVGTVLWTFHFLLLEAYSGCLLNLMCAARSIIYSKRSTKEWARSISWVYVFTVGALLVYASQFLIFDKQPTITNIVVELLPTVGVIATNIGYRLESGFKVRCSQFISSPVWLIYNICIKSIGGTVTEIFALASTVIGIIRHDIKDIKKKHA